MEKVKVTVEYRGEEKRFECETFLSLMCNRKDGKLEVQSLRQGLYGLTTVPGLLSAINEQRDEIFAEIIRDIEKVKDEQHLSQPLEGLLTAVIKDLRKRGGVEDEN